MTTTILRPNTQITGGPWTASAGTALACLSDASDATYVTAGAIGTGKFGLSTGPVGTGSTARLHWRWSTSGWPGGVTWRKADGTVIAQVNGALGGGGVGATITSSSAFVDVSGLTQADIDNSEIWLTLTTTATGRTYDVWVELIAPAPPLAPTFTAPGFTVTTRRPLIDWNYNKSADGSASQWGYQARTFTPAQWGVGGFDPGSSPATLDTGFVPTSTTQYVPSTNLKNGGTYRTYVRTYADNQWGPWLGVEYQVSIPVPTPTSVTPVNGGTIASSRPSFGANGAAMGDGALYARSWEFASDELFTEDYQVLTEAVYTNTKSGSVSYPAPYPRLPQGVWYLRARAIDQDDQTSGYSSTQSFTIAHAPTTNSRVPAGATSIPYNSGSVLLDWTFSDLDVTDSQTRYEVELWKLSDPVTSLQTSGDTASVNSQHTFSGLDATWKDTELRWRVRVADLDGVWSTWSVDQAFFLRDLPALTITHPVSGGTVNNPAPTITWDFAASDGRTQHSYRVIVQDLDNNNVVADSAAIANAAARSFTVPSPVIDTGVSYQVTVTVTDSVGLSKTITHAFTATYVLPTSPDYSVDDANFFEEGVVYIDWSGAVVDPTNLGWRVYRRITGTNTWTLVADYPTLVKQHFDYLAPSNTQVDYAVVQVAESFGDPVESAYPVQSFVFENINYLIVCPDNPALNLRLYSVTADTFGDEQEMATINLMGRGRRVEYGTRFGQQGQLTAQFTDRTEMSARVQRMRLEQLRDSGLKVYLRNPFGDVWAVGLEQAQIARMAGMGLHEAATATITYTEITA